MSSENIKRANALLQELNRQRAAKAEKAKEVWSRQLRESPVKGRKPPGEYRDSSYLYIRSYDGDNGVRPGANNVPYYRSPDLNVAPVASMNSYTTELQTGQLYQLSCLVHNRGDFIVPSAKVEFYLVTPSLGFDTRYAKKLGVTATWVDCYSSSEVHIQYLVPPEDAGHRCLFARVFSFSPLDIPLYDTLLSPYEDRHIGQKNLNIAAQSTAMQINLLHMPQDMVQVRFTPMKRDEILAMRHPVAADFQIVDHEKMAALAAGFRLRPAGKLRERIGLKAERGAFGFSFNGDSRYSPEAQLKIKTQVRRAMAAIAAGKAKATDFRELFAGHRAMLQEQRMTLLDLQLPDLGLRKGELAGFEITAAHQLSGEVFGGITLLVTA